MNKKDSLADRMKRYENVPRLSLTRRIPVIMRIDGKAFHTFTRGFQKPFDPVMMKTMQDTMKYLCENVQGCVLGYTQSDEITLVLTDYATIDTDAWFGYSVQKMVSVAAGMAVMAFNRAFSEYVREFIKDYGQKPSSSESAAGSEEANGESCINVYQKRMDVYLKRMSQAVFDARAFSLPAEEVCNCLIWRQQDAIRNSIQSAGRANFSQKQLNRKNGKQIQEMLWQECGINWEDYPTDCKRGSCCIRKQDGIRNPWVIDRDPPVFTEDREYIERLLDRREA